MDRHVALVLSLLMTSVPTAYGWGQNPQSHPRNIVTVRPAGGDYADPVEAAKNAYEGEAWCRAAAQSQACRMRIGAGLFFLAETLHIPDGITVRGAGKDRTILVAEQGVATAVTSSGPGNVTIRDLTIFNSQPGAMLAVGYRVDGPEDLEVQTLTKLTRVAIHVQGAQENIALSRYGRMVVSQAELTAPGGVGTENFNEAGAPLRLLESTISAAAGIVQRGPDPGGPGLVIQLVDSHVSSIDFNSEESVLEIRGGTTGLIEAVDQGVILKLVGVHVRGGISWDMTDGVMLDGVTVEGNIGNGFSSGTFTVRRSYIVDDEVAVRATDAGAVIEQSVLRAPVAVRVSDGATATLVSTLAAGDIVVEGARASCRDSYGQEYQLLGEDCLLIEP